MLQLYTLPCWKVGHGPFARRKDAIARNLDDVSNKNIYEHNQKVSNISLKCY